MAPRSQDSSPLDIRLRPRAGALVALMPVAGLLPVLRQLLAPEDRFDFLTGCVATVLCGALTVFFMTVLLRLRAMGCLLRLDAEGVTVHGRATVPWSDLSEVRSDSTGKRAPQVVVFIPKPGTTLPAMPTGLPRSSPEARAAALTRRYGSALVFHPVGMSATVPEVLAAAQRLGNLPHHPATR